MNPDVDNAELDELIADIGRGPEHTVALLQALQVRYRYLPPAALRRLCERAGLTPATVAGVATFFNQFRHRPLGRHLIRVCHGTACHIKGAERVHDAIRRHLHLAPDEDTDASGMWTVEPVACLGCCTLAPAVQIDHVTYGYLNAERVPATLRDFLEVAQHGGTPPLESARARVQTRTGALGEVRIGLGSCCLAKGSGEVHRALTASAADAGVDLAVHRVGCVGICYQTPIVEVATPGHEPVLYTQVKTADVPGIVRRHFPPRGPIRRARAALTGLLDDLITGTAWTPPARHGVGYRDPTISPFFGRQVHLATELVGQIDPLDLDAYVAAGGFTALQRCLTEWSADHVIDRIRRSGLRGRGGAGFPTGQKWAAVRAAAGRPRHVIANGDEGDPGAFMDRMILESFPFRVVEGLAIATHTVGGDEALLYIRAEYPLAVERIRAAIAAGEQHGYLGDNVLGQGIRLQMQVREGAGAFVCGEETGMIAALEGRRGQPRFRPPYPAESGFHGQPTLINNVETLACVPWILQHGPDAYAALGTDHSKGTKVFALAGKVQRGGLIEVPMGVTIREIVEEIGGGVAPGRRLKAVQIGGPSGGCVPAALADTPIDYEALLGVGAMMGSGGIVVLDDTDCMVDVARYFMRFIQAESCGKCTLCRVGTKRLLEILDRLVVGQGRPDDLQELGDLARQVAAGSLCGLGRTAPNPILSTLRYFRDEYEAHLAGRCPAHRCTALIAYSISDACIGCTRCAQHCPVDAIAFTPHQRHTIDRTKCVHCDTCRQVCPSNAVQVN